MGTWGVGLSSNDAFEDIYHAFFELYNEGLEIHEITNRLLADNKDLQTDYEDQHSLWFALAKAQWECGALNKDTYEKVKSIIEGGHDLKLWQELNGNSGKLKKRAKVLDEFLSKISTPNSKIRKRKKIVLRKAVFEKGECLVFKLKNGSYGGALVLEAENDTEFGMNLLALTTIDQLEKPTVHDFETAFIFTVRQEDWPGKYQEQEFITWCYAQYFKKARTQFQSVGLLSVNKAYNSKDHLKMFSNWDSIAEHVDNREAYEMKHGKASLTVELKDWR